MSAQIFNLATNRYPSYTNRLSINHSSKGILFCDFATEYLSKCHKTEKAKKAYRDALRHFIKFCKLNNLSPFTYQLGMEMMDNFVYYLQATTKLMSSTVCNHLVRIKTLIKMASITHGVAKPEHLHTLSCGCLPKVNMILVLMVGEYQLKMNLIHCIVLPIS